MECIHKNTVHGELIGLTPFELCVDCGMSRSEWEQGTGDWMRDEGSCKNVARQWRKLRTGRGRSWEVIKLLQEIAAAFVDCGYVGFPEFIEKDKVCLDGYDKQPSDLPSCEHEYVEQSCGIAGDDYSGHVIYPFRGMFIKVAFSC